MAMNNNKTIILGMPKRFGFHEMMINNLSKEGFTVVDISFEDEKFVYKNTRERITNFLRKTFLNDKEFKIALKFKHQKAFIEDKLTYLKEKVDYALIIRPDLYHETILNLVKKKSKKMVAYQWDGFDRFPKVKSLIPIFDAFYVFDEDDATYPGVTSQITNFYFNLPVEKKSISYDVYYLGVYIENRMDDILSLLHFMNTHQLNPKVELLAHGKRDLEEDYKHIKGLDFFRETKKYEKILELNTQAKVLADFINKEHTGLSFRCFEAMYLGKKLITTNIHIKHYDFYNPKNIFVWGEDDSSSLREFIETPYEEIPQELMEKYSLSGWINTILS